MHETRKKILEVLCGLGFATVDQIAAEMQRQTERNISSVTVRYHLNILQQEGLVSEPRHLERSSRGRPQHLFTATTEEKSEAVLQAYVDTLLAVLNIGELTEQQMNGIGQNIAALAGDLSQMTLEERLDTAVLFLNQRGYKASWARGGKGIILTTDQCPYHDVAAQTPHLCKMDVSLMQSLIGAEPHRLTHIAGGDEACSYWFDVETTAATISE